MSVMIELPEVVRRPQAPNSLTLFTNAVDLCKCPSKLGERKRASLKRNKGKLSHVSKFSRNVSTRGYPLSTYAKFSEKLTFFTP